MARRKGHKKSCTAACKAARSRMKRAAKACKGKKGKTRMHCMSVNLRKKK